MTQTESFNRSIITMLDEYLHDQDRRYPKNDRLTIDLHCHDHHSDVPDEQLARILAIPETWLSTESLLQVLKSHGCSRAI